MDVEVFIGDLKDPRFNYEKGDWNGNCPNRISECFPTPHSIYFGLISKIEKNELKGRQTDWGSWTAILYPHELTEVVKELYGEEEIANNKGLRRILDFIRKLDEDQQYGLVACEMP